MRGAATAHAPSHRDPRLLSRISHLLEQMFDILERTFYCVSGSPVGGR